MGISVIGGATGGGGGKSIKYAEFLSTSSWTCPSDVTQVRALVCGGGGGGIDDTTGGTDQTLAGFGSVDEKVLTVVPGTTYTITIGAGGAVKNVGSSTNQIGNSGSASSVGGLFTVAGADGGLTGNHDLMQTYNNLNAVGPVGFGGFGAIAAVESTRPGAARDAYGGYRGKGGGGGAHRSGQKIQSPSNGGGYPYISTSDRTRALTPNALPNSGAGGASGVATSSNQGGNGGSGYVLLEYSTAE